MLIQLYSSCSIATWQSNANDICKYVLALAPWATNRIVLFDAPLLKKPRQVQPVPQADQGAEASINKSA
jgi:hypothetical protein